ncbi:hypothetical protein [Deinococcus humi]|uniref:Major facilitator superfamily (MFS) profile domain-containing protein n=1 Tax=Deinococcus humi TaxID=662880 RepID=A0A7W8NEG6_9DEIO|nr:hypothetical protein [Deinococcus humi]MBB5360932.1 hypothetical protein [Deinococcus humi]GGO17653.1 hypothetical protein GCM10008949_00020 [Deinococcus humi]
MLKTNDPTRVYLVLSAGLSFAFTLAYTLQGLYFVTVAGLDPLQLLLIGAALEGAAFVLEVQPAWWPMCTRAAARWSWGACAWAYLCCWWPLFQCSGRCC